MPEPTLIEYGAVSGVGLAAVLVGTLVRFSNLPPTPRIAAPTQQTTSQSLQTLKFSPAYHKAQVERDTQTAGVVFDYAQIADPYPYFLELDNPKSLAAKKDSFSTPHLEISTYLGQEWVGGGLKTDHVFLRIKNKTRNYLAYRVDTTMPDLRACKDSAALPHDAIALKPGEEVDRVECVYRKGDAVTIRKIEIVELPAIGFHYVVRLNPTQVLMDPRIGRGHSVAGVKQCSLIPWQEIREGADAKEVTWADVIDFYGRHSCDEYSFFRGYRRQDTKRTLPAQAAK